MIDREKQRSGAKAAVRLLRIARLWERNCSRTGGRPRPPRLANSGLVPAKPGRCGIRTGRYIDSAVHGGKKRLQQRSAEDRKREREEPDEDDDPCKLDHWSPRLPGKLPTSRLIERRSLYLRGFALEIGSRAERSGRTALRCAAGERVR